MFMLTLALITAVIGFHAPLRKSNHRVAGVRSPYTLKNITQPVDHLNRMITKTFQHRYLVNDTAWVKGGPIFLNTGAEGGDIEDIFWDYGSYFDIIMSVGGLAVFSEHRYFGDSYPFGTAAESLKNTSNRIGYLSTEQSLRDNIELIKHIKKQYNATDSPVITFGGSLSGTLAGISRLRFPEVVDAAWCSSSPLQGFVGIQNFSQYSWMERVTLNWEYLSPGCADVVRDGFWNLLDSKAAAAAKAFNTCEGPDALTIPTLYDMVFAILQSNAEFIYPPAASTIPDDCARMTNGSGLAIFANLLRAQDVPCLNLSQYRNATNTTTSRSWSYLACTEIIHPIGSNNISDMFPPNPWSASSLRDWCYSVFGDSVIVDPQMFPNLYGLYDLRKLYKTTSRILWAYGSLDPWATMGMPLEGSTGLLPVIHIPNGSHCADAAPSNPLDQPAMVAARAHEKVIIQQFLSDIALEKETMERRRMG